MGDVVTIKAASAESGLSVDTIRYYERIGVLPRVARTANRYRGYTREHIETLRLARTLRDLGLPLPEMAALVRVFHDGTCRDMQKALEASARDALDRVVAHQKQLKRAEHQLRSVLAEVETIAPDEQAASGLTPCPCVIVIERKVVEAAALAVPD